MPNTIKYRVLNILVALVWLINGLLCKVLNLVPRHQQIVSRILGEKHAHVLTVMIGFSEIAMTIWILSGIRTRLNCITQILIIATMNTIEFILVPDLLLWGRANSLFAFLFMTIIFYNEFYIRKNRT